MAVARGFLRPPSWRCGNMQKHGRVPGACGLKNANKAAFSKII
jgi:hypothetical protein